MKKFRESIVRTWLLGGFAYADRRIKAGDLDLDDTLHRIRSSTGELLRLYFDTEPDAAKRA